MTSLGFVLSFALLHAPVVPPLSAAQARPAHLSAQSPTMAGQTDSTRNQVVSMFLDRPRFICANCSAALALQDELISKSFSGRDGPAFLMHTAVNVKLGRKEDRQLMTGVHTVADLFCLGCNDYVGWYYHKAPDHSQRYKEGKYLLEREKLVKENNWKLGD